LSVEQLRAKSGKTMLARAVAGHREYLQKGWQRARGAIVSSPGFAGFAAPRPRAAKKPFY